MKTKTTILVNGIKVPIHKTCKDVPVIAQMIKEIKKDLPEFNYLFNTDYIAESGMIGRFKVKVIVEVVKSGQNK